MKILEKEDDWRISFEKCKPYLTGCNVALDVGARGGEFAYYLNGFKTVHCFEFRGIAKPVEKRFFKRCPDEQKYKFHPIGISDHNGHEYTTNLRVGRIKGRGFVKIKVKTIDSLGYTDVDFIKLDVEGHEYKCVVGAEQTIRKYNPVIIVEQNRNDFTASELLKQWGYVVMDTFNVDNKIHDYIMVKK